MNPPQEDLFGRRAVRLLDDSVYQVPPEIRARLRAMRDDALAVQRVSAPRLQLAGMPAGWTLNVGRPLRTLAAIAALLAGMAGTYAWNMINTAEENADIDSALLADDLPIEAFTDQGFDEWLEAEH